MDAHYTRQNMVVLFTLRDRDMRSWVKASEEAGDLFTEGRPDLGVNWDLCLVIRFLIFTFCFLWQVNRIRKSLKGAHSFSFIFTEL